jgi:hypothetical protein
MTPCDKRRSGRHITDLDCDLKTLASLLLLSRVESEAKMPRQNERVIYFEYLGNSVIQHYGRVVRIGLGGLYHVVFEDALGERDIFCTYLQRAL